MEIVTNIFFYFFSFIILLSIIVFVHEFGHYIAAIINKVKVETFSIGFGKEIYGWNDKRGTRWKISILPFGGYVKMFGEDFFSKKKVSSSLSKFSFSEKNVYQRIFIVAAGPLANFLFAILCYGFLFTFIGKQNIQPIVSSVVENSPAAIAGIVKDDKILKVSDKKIKDWRDISLTIKLSQQDLIDFEILRDEKIILKQIKPVIINDEKFDQNTPKIGIIPYEPTIEKYPFYYSLYLGTKTTYEICSYTMKGLYLLIVGKVSKEDIGGPLKIAQVSGQFLEAGFLAFFNLIILLSVSIGLINLFPIPVLDGGHLVFYFIEMILGKPVNKNIQENMFKFGFAIIITLAVFLTYNDIINIFKF